MNRGLWEFQTLTLAQTKEKHYLDGTDKDSLLIGLVCIVKLFQICTLITVINMVALSPRKKTRLMKCNNNAECS